MQLCCPARQVAPRGLVSTHSTCRLKLLRCVATHSCCLLRLKRTASEYIATASLPRYASHITNLNQARIPYLRRRAAAKRKHQTKRLARTRTRSCQSSHHCSTPEKSISGMQKNSAFLCLNTSGFSVTVANFLPMYVRTCPYRPCDVFTPWQWQA